MKVKPFSDSQIFRAAWQRVWDQIAFILLLGLGMLAFLLGFDALVQWISSESVELGMVAQLVYLVIFFIVSVGLFKITLDIADGKDGDATHLYKHWKIAPSYLAVSILWAIVTYGGAILLIVPGVIFGLMFYFAPWIVIDKEVGPIVAMRESAALIKGMKWDLFAFVFLAKVITLLGLMALGVGLFITVPLAGIATAMLYRHLS